MKGARSNTAPQPSTVNYVGQNALLHIATLSQSAPTILSVQQYPTSPADLGSAQIVIDLG